MMRNRSRSSSSFSRYRRHYPSGRRIRCGDSVVPIPGNWPNRRVTTDAGGAGTITATPVAATGVKTEGLPESDNCLVGSSCGGWRVKVGFS